MCVCVRLVIEMSRGRRRHHILQLNIFSTNV
jgi:hypothetical protein